MILLAIAAPRLRGSFARLYKILANNDKRPLVDEQLLVQILGDSFQRQIARELDADRPLRRFGLVDVAGERPNASLDDRSTRRALHRESFIRGRARSTPEVRHVERDLEELHMPRDADRESDALPREPTEDEPARIVVRGRAGSGRHTLLASLAARAGRALGVIDLATMPRECGAASPSSRPRCAARSCVA